jgi:hypothetical protein
VQSAEKYIRVLLSNATNHQLLVAILERLDSLEASVSELSQSVTDLQGAVDGVAQRLLPHIADLEAALAAAQADDATAAQAQADAQAAVAAIRAEVDALNALGTDPSTPVDTDAPPVEPPPVEVPADPDAPHADQTLPGDLPTDPEAGAQA